MSPIYEDINLLISNLFATDFSLQVLIDIAKSTVSTLIRNPLVIVLFLCWIVKQFFVLYDPDKGIKETKASEITSTKHYNEVLQQSHTTNALIVFYFYAPW